MITAARLTRTALELDIPAHIFAEVAENIRALNFRISTAFLIATVKVEWKDAEEMEKAYDSYRRGQIQNLLEK